MIDVHENLKNILRNDRFPLADSITPKDIEISFDGMDPIYTDQVVDDSFSLDEGIIAEDNLRFGTCRASQIKFKLANTPVDLKGKEFTIDQLIAGYTVPLGKYKVDSAKLQDDLIFKEVIAYDKLRSIDVDVAGWYNGLFPTGSETYTLKQFRSSLLAYLGIEEVSQTLPNDDMIVEKTIDPSQISGRTVLEATVELNGAFGNINRNGKFRRIVLQPAYGLYPSETLYPADDLYPISETNTSYTQFDIISENVSNAMYQSIRFEEHTVKEIDKLIIRSDENDIGAIVGSGSNAYVIEGNFLAFGKSAAELEQIAINAFGNMAKRPYRPYEAESIGLPYIEVGDTLEFATDDTVVGYVLQRTLTGIQALTDEYSSPGSEDREQNFGVNKEIIQLQGKTTRIKKDVEGVRVEVGDLASGTDAKFEIVAGQILQEVTRATAAEGVLSGQITVMAGEINLKVSKDNVISSINLSPEAVTIKANKINFNGYATFDSNGGITSIDGAVLKTGTVVADTVKVGISIDSPIINGGTINGGTFTTTGGYGTVTISNGGMIADYASVTSLYVPTQLYVGGSIHMVAYDGSISAAKMTCYNLNNGVPVTSDNVGSQAVWYASSSGTVSSLSGHTTNEITASDTGYGNIDFQGFDNAAGVNYVQNNYQRITTSDIRLKYDIHSLDDIPDEIFYGLKPKRFRYKTPFHGDKMFFGLIAQQLENAFKAHGLDPYEYDLIEVKDVKKYTDDGFYVKDETHRIHYNNLIAWLIKIVQKQNERIMHLENIIK